MLYLGIALAGGLGCVLRYSLGRVALSLPWTIVPYGTLLTNLIGCFLIGYLSWTMVHRLHLSEQFQIIIIAGFLGGFTTFSAFTLEAITVYQQGGSPLRFLMYVIIQVTLCILMCLLGLMMAKQT